jgi:hypothetical protein
MSTVSPIIPAAEEPVTRVPRTVRELVEFLSLTAEPHWMYHCMQGEPRAYMEIHTGDPRLEVVRGVYVTLHYQARGRRSDVEAQLVSTMWDVFVAARDEFIERNLDHPILFWRMMPHIEEDPPVPDGVDGNGSPVEGRDYWRTRLRCRVWIPGIDLSSLCRTSKEPLDVGT